MKYCRFCMKIFDDDKWFHMCSENNRYSSEFVDMSEIDEVFRREFEDLEDERDYYMDEMDYYRGKYRETLNETNSNSRSTL